MAEIIQKTEAQKAHELERLKAWVKKLVPNDYDKFDTLAFYDPLLSYDENKSQMREKLKVFVKEDLKTQAEIAKAQQDKLDNERIKAAEKEVEEYNNNLVYSDNKDLDAYYSPIVRGVNKLCQGYSNLLFIKGRGGIGKSYQIRKALAKNKAEYVEICGEVTEAYLYKLIYDNNGKVIWFKDVVKLLTSIGSLNLLKSATESQEVRMLTKSNFSRQQENLPDYFVCKCKFIFDYNNLFGLQLKQDFEALVTRGDYKEMPFSDDDVKNIVRLIAKGDVTKEEVTEFLISKFESNGIIKLNLRTQWKALRTREYAEKNGLDWKKELSGELDNVSKIRALLYTLIGTKAIRTADLKRLLMKNEIANTVRTSHRMVADWLFLQELHKVSGEEKDFFICINDFSAKKKDNPESCPA